jgi:hypothetical protein
VRHERASARCRLRSAGDSPIPRWLIRSQLSEVTVKNHPEHIFTNLDLRDRTAAIVFAFDNGIAEPQA